MAWTTATARDRFRIMAGDGVADHADYKAEVSPTPDGIHERFFVGRRLLVDDATLQVFIAGALQPPSSYIMTLDEGVVAIPSKPTEPVLVSFHYLWFRDAEVDAFLDNAAKFLGYSGADDASLPGALQAVILDLAAAEGFTRKAAEYAETLEAASPDGYSINTGKSHPNWAKLAADALARAEKKWKWYLDSPLSSAAPAIAFTNYTMPIYTPGGHT